MALLISVSCLKPEGIPRSAESQCPRLLTQKLVDVIVWTGLKYITCLVPKQHERASVLV